MRRGGLKGLPERKIHEFVTKFIKCVRSILRKAKETGWLLKNNVIMVTSNLQDKGKGEALYFYIKPEDLSSDFKFLPPWSLDLLIRVPFQLHEEH